MKKKSVFWGIVLIVAAVLLVLDGVGQSVGILEDVPVVRIILGVLCLAWAGNEIFKLRIYNVFFPLAFLFILFEDRIAALCGIADGEIMSNWLVLLAALLLSIGMSILFRKNNKEHIEWHCENGKWEKVESKTHSKTRFGTQSKYIDSADFSEQYIENNMGNTEVFFDNAEEYKGNGVLTLENNMGRIRANIPAGWSVRNEIETALGTIQEDDFPKDGPLLTVRGECNMGCIFLSKA